MRIEVLKQKFDSDISELKKDTEKLDGVLDSDILANIEEVVLEWQTDLGEEVQVLIDENISLKKQLKELNQN